MDCLKLSFLVTSIIMVIGCRDDQNVVDSIQQSNSYQAKVIDGYLRNAQVWLDLNGNYKHDNNEPSTYSTQLGDVELDLSDFDGDPTQYRLVALASENKTVDEDHGEALDKSYMLVAPPGVRNITPLSHLVHSKQVSEGLTFEQASSQIAALMEKDQQDLFEDYVEGRETELHAIARSLVVVIPETIPVQEPVKLKQQHSGFESVVEGFKKHKSRKTQVAVPIDYEALELNPLARDERILGDSDMLSLLFEERDSDGDGISDGKDADDDNDGIEDQKDAMPRNALESEDSDQDGFGDSEDSDPNDPMKVAKRSEVPSVEQLESEYLNTKKLIEKLQLEVSGDLGELIPKAKLELLLTDIRKVESEALNAYLTQKTLEQSTSEQDKDSKTPSQPALKKGTEEKTTQTPVKGDDSSQGAGVTKKPEGSDGETQGDGTGNTDKTDGTKPSTPNPTGDNGDGAAKKPEGSDGTAQGDGTGSTDKTDGAKPSTPNSTGSNGDGVTKKPEGSDGTTQGDGTGSTDKTDGAKPSTPNPTGDNDDGKTKTPDEVEKGKKPEEVVPVAKTPEPDKTPVSKPLTEIDKLQLRTVADLVYQQKVVANALERTIIELADEYLTAIHSDGSWSDIEYQSTTASYRAAELHLQKMNTLATAYHETKEEKYKQSVNQALKYWFELNPTVDWWRDEIAKPQTLSSVALMLGDALSIENKDKIVAVLPTQVDVNLSAKTRFDIALGVIYHGLLSENSQLVRDGIIELQKTIAMTTDEGMQPDWSFHHHGAQIHNGSYGEKFLTTAVNLAYNVHDLEWKFEQGKVELLAGLLLEGRRWMDRHGQLDYNVYGSGIARPKAENNRSVPELTIMDKIATLAPNKKPEADAYKAHVYPDSGSESGSGLSGFRYFWRSDYSVTAEDGFMFGIKMNSERTVPNENDNGENLLGYWLGFGSTFLMQTGKEYHNIFPVWDWKKIPGVTAPEFKEAPYYKGSTMQNVSFVGAASDGKIGVTTMVMDMTIDHIERTDVTQEREQRVKLTPDLGNTKAHKSWFSFGNQIVALGSGISSTHSKKVNTTINQTLLKGAVTSANSENLTVNTVDADISTSRWVHHDGVGYVFLDDSDRVVSVQTQNGTWDKIKSGGPDFEIFKDVFTLSIPHGFQPREGSYQYIILPDRSVQSVMDYQQSIPVKVLSNTTKIQAVEDTDKNIVSAVFFEPGELTISPDYKVAVDRPSVVILDFASQPQDVVVSLATPGVPYSVVDVTLEQHGQWSKQRVVTPGTKALLGKSINFVFSEGQQLNFSEHATELAKRKEKESISLNLLPLQDTFVQGGGTSTNNYGSKGYMQVANQGAAFDRRIFLNFDLRDIKHYQVTEAVLKLYLRGAIGESDVIVKLVEVDNPVAGRSTFDWSETRLIFDSLPTLAALATTNAVKTGKSKTDQWIEFDVTNLIKSVAMEKRSNVTFELEEITNGGSHDYLSFATKERDGSEPQLIIHGKEIAQ